MTLDELDRLLAEATNSKWHVDDMGTGYDYPGGDLKVEVGIGFACPEVPGGLIDCGDYQTTRLTDARLASAAVNALPALLAVARAARACRFHANDGKVYNVPDCAPALDAALADLEAL